MVGEDKLTMSTKELRWVHAICQVGDKRIAEREAGAWWSGRIVRLGASCGEWRGRAVEAGSSRRGEAVESVYHGANQGEDAASI